MPAEAGRIRNALSVDVEDYFQVQAFADVVSREDWPQFESRVERNTERILDLFAESAVTATFFVLGWVAERHPGLVRRIVAEGHELASHGWEHRLVGDQSPREFLEDVRRTRELLEEVGATDVRGYRAATFSIGRNTQWAFDGLIEAGYGYSSSVYPVHHDLYGMPEAPRAPFRPRPGAAFMEYPMSVLDLFGKALPCSGGGYFRLLPYAIYRRIVDRMNREQGQPCIFYIHPWEIDPGQPRMRGISAKARFRHYLNLERTEARLRRLLGDFAWGRLDHVFANASLGV